MMVVCFRVVPKRKVKGEYQIEIAGTVTKETVGESLERVKKRIVNAIESGQIPKGKVEIQT